MLVGNELPNTDIKSQNAAYHLRSVIPILLTGIKLAWLRIIMKGRLGISSPMQ